MSLERLSKILENRLVRKNLRFKLACRRLKRSVMATHPKCGRELEKRIDDYLKANPKVKKLMDDISKTTLQLVSEFSQYGK